MTIRKFVAGDRVQKRSGGPIMIVQKYCLRQHVFGGNSHSSHDVECVWYENGRRESAIFDQRTLSKVSIFPPSSHVYNNIGNIGKPRVST